jgi:hypothetical protein
VSELLAPAALPRWARAGGETPPPSAPGSALSTWEEGGGRGSDSGADEEGPGSSSDGADSAPAGQPGARGAAAAAPAAAPQAQEQPPGPQKPARPARPRAAGFGAAAPQAAKGPRKKG